MERPVIRQVSISVCAGRATDAPHGTSILEQVLDIQRALAEPGDESSLEPDRVVGMGDRAPRMK